MNITATVFPLKEAMGSLVGFAKVIIDDVLVIDSWKIYNGQKGLWVATPSRDTGKKKDDGSAQYEDYVKFLDVNPEAEGEAKYSQLKKEIQAIVLKAWGEATGASERANVATARTQEKPSGPARKPKSAW